MDSNTPLSTRDTSRSVSPCSATACFPEPSFSVTDLAASFANSRLRHDSQICYDACEAYANTDDDDASWTIPGDDDRPALARSRTFPSRSYSPSRRTQRQSNARLLCSTSHAKDIAALVSRMVDCKQQCEVVESSARSIEVEDEGYDSPDASQSRRSSLAVQKMQIEYRRSSDLKAAAGARVRKTVRCKKERKHVRVRSSEMEDKA